MVADVDAVAERRFRRGVPGVHDELGGHTINVGAAVGHDTVIPLCLRVFGVIHGNNGVVRGAACRAHKRKTPHAANRAGFLAFSTVDRPILP
jgi:hypothetical protein